MIGSYFEETTKGFKISKDEFGEGNYELNRDGFQIKIIDSKNEIAVANIEEYENGKSIEKINNELLTQLVDHRNGNLFLEVVGGSDTLKQFLRKLLKEEKFESN